MKKYSQYGLVMLPFLLINTVLSPMGTANIFFHGLSLHSFRTWSIYFPKFKEVL